MLSRKKFISFVFAAIIIAGGFLYSAAVARAVEVYSPSSDTYFDASDPAVSVKSAQLASGQKTQSLFSKALDTLSKGLAKAGSVAFQHGLTTMLNTLAYDAANYVASGMTGQKAAFETRSLGQVFTDSLDAAAGDFLYKLGKDGMGGLNLCEPSLGLDLKIGLGLYQFQRPQPACTFSQMRNNWETELRSATFLKDFQDYFNPTSNDLGIALSANTMFFQKQVDEANSKLEQLKMDQGWLNVRNLAGETTTPAPLIKASVEADLIKKPEDVVKFTGDALVDALNIFLNQLAIQLMRNLLYGGLYKGGGANYAGGIYNPTADVTAGGGVAAARDQFRKIMQPRFDIRGDYDILAELTQCPDPTKAGPTNCVITDKFRQAVQERKTVGQAMEEGMLNAAGVFGFSGKNLEPRYQDENYPYRSMLILRKFRILPVGWEVAANYINEHAGDASTLGKAQLTLKDLVDCFDQSRWCHDLVDPNWVLKAPLNYCAREGYGPETFGEPQIVNNSYLISRKDNYCADEQACIKENSDGSCQVYGYCTQERRTWNFGNNSCNPLYNTCETFTKTDGSTISYLKNTLDWCGSNGNGCQSYATVYDYASSKWTDGAQNIYLNSNAGTCNAESEGCHEFLRIDKGKVESLTTLPNSGDSVSSDYYNSTSTVYEKLLPKYLANETGDITGVCYKNQHGSYQLKADAPAICANFVRQCTAAEVGCELYTRVRDSFTVPAQVKQTDYCPAECDGYDMYLQAETTFEAQKAQYFIPETAKACSAQAAGCDEFTNLDEVAKGGEGIEYYSVLRQCVMDGTQAATFYTWEGSDETGFQLRAFTLKDNAGRPAVFDPQNETTEEQKIGDTVVCNADIFNRSASDPFYNSDCRQFYSKTGTISYRLYTHTISYDTNCHPYRRSELSSGDDATKCTAMGGDLKVAPGYCVFMAIPGQGVTCGASENKCREYKGNVGNNIRNILTDDFENGTVEGWLKQQDSQTQIVETANASLKVNGHSLLFYSSTKPAEAIKDISGLLQAGKTYTVEFAAMSRIGATTQLIVDLVGVSNNQLEVVQLGVVNTSNSWQNYFLNLTSLPEKVAKSSSVFLRFTVNTEKLHTYLDYVILREVTDNYYLIKDSWKTPGTCIGGDGIPKVDGQGNAIAGDNAGCYEYRDRADQSYYLKSFSKLCSESGVGCELMIDTQNYTPREGKAKWNVAADKFIYLVYDASKTCGADDKGCQFLGEPVKYGDKIISHNDVYLKNNPDKYDTILCSAAEVGCSAYSSQSGTAYFKDPGNKVCEYRQGYNGTYGWWQKKVSRCDNNNDGKIIHNATSPYAPEGGYDNLCLTDSDCGQLVSNTSCTTDQDCKDKGTGYYCATQSGGGKKCQVQKKCLLDNWDTACLTDKDKAPKTIGFGGANNRIEQPAGKLENEDSSYRWVGICPAAQSGCTEIIDPVSTPGANLIFNGDFKQKSDDTNYYGWDYKRILDGGSKYVDNYTQVVKLKQNTLYRLGMHDTSENWLNIYNCKANVLGDMENRANNLSIYYLTNIKANFWDKKVPDDGKDSNGNESNIGGISSGTTDSVSQRSVLFFSGNATACVAKVYSPRGTAELKEAIINYQLASGLDSTSCNGQPNYTDGCVPFNVRSLDGSGYKKLTYDADAISMTGKEDKNEATQQLTACASGDAACDSNTILKVQHDRVCSEWLACRSYALVDEGQNKNQKVCYDIGTCDGLDEANQCKSWVSAEKKNQTVKILTTLNIDESKIIDAKAITNATGYSQVGFWNNSTTTEGSFMLGSMEQGGDLVVVPNGNFEITNTEGVPSGWELRNNDAGATAVAKEIKTNMVSVVSTPQQAQNLSIAYPIEGHNILSLGVAFQLHSQVPLEVSPNNDNYSITAQINTLSLTSGKAHIIVQGIRSNGSIVEKKDITQSAGMSWNLKFARFDTDGVNNIKIIIKTDSGATGNVYVDDIKIRPTLQTRLVTADKAGSQNAGDYWYTQQSCRLYPQAESLSCDYIDDSGIREKGWYGYCLQYDRNPGNPNACLLWWPIDQVRGDGFDEQVAAYSGRYPVYYTTKTENYCASSGNPPLTFIWHAGNDCDGEPLTANECGSSGTISKCGFCIDKQGYAHVYSKENEGSNCCCDNLPAGWQKGDGWDTERRGCYAHWVTINPIIKNLTPELQSQLPFVVGRGGQASDEIVKYFGSIHQAGNKYWGAEELCAVKEVQKLYFTNDSTVNISILKTSSAAQETVATELVQTITPIGQNKVWSSRIKEGSSLDLSCTDALNNIGASCRYESDLYPFGSIAYPAPADNPMQWVAVGNDKAPLVAGEPNGQARFRYQFIIDELKKLFAKSFGIWEWKWNAGNQNCVGTFGGVKVLKCSNDSSKSCSTIGDETQCVITEYPQTITTSVCAGGVKDNKDCSSGLDLCKANSADDCANSRCAAYTLNPGRACDDSNFLANCWNYVDINKDSYVCDKNVGSATYGTCLSGPLINKECFNAAGNPDDSICQTISGTCETKTETVTIPASNGTCLGVCDNDNNLTCSNDAQCRTGSGYFQNNSSIWNPPTTECKDIRPAIDTAKYGEGHDLSNGQNPYYCAIKPKVENIKVDNTELTAANPLAHLTFTTAVDNDQLPLTEVRVNWGDGYTTSISGAELRSRPSMDAPFSFYHFYDYWDLLKKKTNCSNDSCSPVISIWIRDNWGWYSGDGGQNTPPSDSGVTKFGRAIVVKP